MKKALYLQAHLVSVLKVMLSGSIIDVALIESTQPQHQSILYQACAQQDKVIKIRLLEFLWFQFFYLKIKTVIDRQSPIFSYFTKIPFQYLL